MQKTDEVFTEIQSSREGRAQSHQETVRESDQSHESGHEQAERDRKKKKKPEIQRYVPRPKQQMAEECTSPGSEESPKPHMRESFHYDDLPPRSPQVHRNTGQRRGKNTRPSNIQSTKDIPPLMKTLVSPASPMSPISPNTPPSGRRKVNVRSNSDVVVTVVNEGKTDVNKAQNKLSIDPASPGRSPKRYSAQKAAKQERRGRGQGSNKEGKVLLNCQIKKQKLMICISGTGCLTFMAPHQIFYHIYSSYIVKSCFV